MVWGGEGSVNGNSRTLNIRKHAVLTSLHSYTEKCRQASDLYKLRTMASLQFKEHSGCVNLQLSRRCQGLYLQHVHTPFGLTAHGKPFHGASQDGKLLSTGTLPVSIKPREVSKFSLQLAFQHQRCRTQPPTDSDLMQLWGLANGWGDFLCGKLFQRVKKAALTSNQWQRKAVHDLLVGLSGWVLKTHAM